jgi:putative antitoxin of VapBC-like toxin-antitoxin system
MATNLAIDDGLIEEARRRGGHKTKKEAVREFERSHSFCKSASTYATSPTSPLDSSDYAEAARTSNKCRDASIAGSPVDMLIWRGVSAPRLADFHDRSRFRPLQQSHSRTATVVVRIALLRKRRYAAGFLSPKISAVKASMVAPFCHASMDNPALRQVCSRKVVRSQPCSAATCGSRRPRLPCMLISSP